MRLVTLTLPDGRPVLVNPELVELVQVCTDPETSARTDISTLGAFAGVRVRETLEDVRRLLELAGAVSDANRGRRVDPSSSAELRSELLLRSLPDLEGQLEAFGSELVARVDAREDKEWRRWAGSLGELLRDSSRDPDKRLELAGALLEASATFGPTGLAAHPSHIGALLAVADAARCYLRHFTSSGTADGACSLAQLSLACAELDSLELVASFTPAERPEGGPP